MLKSEVDPAVVTNLSELLFLHAALGRGYVSPFPATKGLVFSSALPAECLQAMSRAESRFTSDYARQQEGLREELQHLEATAKGGPVAAVTGNTAARREQLRALLALLPNPTWKQQSVQKDALVELLKKSRYGALTYVDQVGARLASSMPYPSRLASDLSWVTLTEGTTDEALIRASATGGACIHSLAGSGAIFNYFCRAQPEDVEAIMERIQGSSSGRVARGSAIVLPGVPAADPLYDERTYHALLEGVYERGGDPPGRRLRVVFLDLSEPVSLSAQWEEFLNWGFDELADRGKPLTDWQTEKMEKLPASPRTITLFASRAALVRAVADGYREFGSPEPALRLGVTDLDAAKTYARTIFALTSGLEKLETRAANAKVAREALRSEEKLRVAEQEIAQAIRDSDEGKIPRTLVRNALPGATLGLLDILVERGVFEELRGVEQCQMGKTTRAYRFPEVTPMSPEEALAELDEAMANHREGAVLTVAEVYKAYGELQLEAARFFSQNVLPCVPITRMSTAQLRALPQVLETFSSSCQVRGAAWGSEVEELLDDEDCPLEEGVPTLWLRYRRGGKPFVDWKKAARLGFAETWGKECSL